MEYTNARGSLSAGHPFRQLKDREEERETKGKREGKGRGNREGRGSGEGQGKGEGELPERDSVAGPQEQGMTRKRKEAHVFYMFETSSN